MLDAMIAVNSDLINNSVPSVDIKIEQDCNDRPLFMKSKCKIIFCSLRIRSRFLSKQGISGIPVQGFVDDKALYDSCVFKTV